MSRQVSAAYKLLTRIPSPRGRTDERHLGQALVRRVADSLSMKQFVHLALCKPYTFTLLAILIVVLGALAVFIVTVLSAAGAAHPLTLP